MHTISCIIARIKDKFFKQRISFYISFRCSVLEYQIIIGREALCIIYYMLYAWSSYFPKSDSKEDKAWLVDLSKI